jgi:hypothetical protein
MKLHNLLLLILTLCCLSVGEAEATEIILDQASSEIFPESWRGGKVAAKAEPLLDSQTQRLEAIIERALAKYPADLLSSTLTRVYGLGQLEYRGIVTGGTRSASAIYIVCKPHFSDEAVERNIHAEYSSILFRKFEKDFDVQRWEMENPSGFHYLGSGSAAVKAGLASVGLDESLHPSGFLTQYSKASLEEDFNAHAARLFTGDSTYWRAIANSPKLKAKSMLVIGFYTKVHREFTEENFRRLR